MADTIPLRFAQSLLRLVPMTQQQLRRELAELNLPLVLLQARGAPENFSMEQLNWLPGLPPPRNTALKTAQNSCPHTLQLRAIAAFGD
jgi:hypothetical protein